VLSQTVANPAVGNYAGTSIHSRTETQAFRLKTDGFDSDLGTNPLFAETPTGIALRGLQRLRALEVVVLERAGHTIDLR